MRKLAVIVAAFCLIFGSTAHAQQTKAAMTTEINTNWPDNTTGLITPALLRSTVTDIVNSYFDANGGTSLSCAAHTWVSALPTLSSITCTQPAVGDISGFGTGVATALGNALNGTSGLVGFSGALGTPTSGTLTNATGLPISTGLTGAGTGVLTALGNNLNASGGLVGFSGALGTPTSGTLTNATGLPISTGVSGLGSGIATALALATNATNGFPTDGAWSTFTASPSCGTATITTNSARSRLYAKTIHLEIDFTITAIGTCTSALTFTLPSVTANSGGGLIGREFGVSGKGFNCDVRSASTTATCSLGDASALQVNAHMVASGVFEIQ